MITKFNHPEHNFTWTDIEIIFINKLLADKDRVIEELQAWKDVVIDELVVLHIYAKKHDTSPKLALESAINYNVEIALDPKVSSDAEALVQLGVLQERERIYSKLFKD